MKRLSACLLSIVILLGMILSTGGSAAADLRGGMPSAVNVAVFEPYYGLDTNYTDRYETVGSAVAQALGGTCTVYRTTDATIDRIAEALQTCAVVIIYSRGETDFMEGDDCVTYAHTSYIRLQSEKGITDADQEWDILDDNIRFRHAFGTGAYTRIDGTAIANHMTGNAANSLLWLAVDLSMATDGIEKPLRSKGVQTVFGYSQSILDTSGDAAFADVFFSAIKKGASVRNAVSLMKRTCGFWDPGCTAETAEEARAAYAAFPIFVSDEDPYPGKGNTDAVQTVRSKWKAKEPTFLYGDVNCSGSVTSADASALLRYVVGLGKISADGDLAADVNVDLRVTSADAAMILRRASGIIAKLPADD